MNYLLYFREVFVKNFCISTRAVQINNIIIKDSLMFYLLRLIPFYFIKNIFYFLNIKCIYLLDNIYFSNYSNNFSIKPIFLSFEILNNYETISIKETIKKYNLTVPFWFLLHNEKLQKYDRFKIKFLLKGSIVIKEGSIDEYKNKLIEELFQM
jgi:hypothetical protein